MRKIRMCKGLAVLMAALLLGGCAWLPQSGDAVTASKISTQQVTRGDLILGLSADGSIALPVTGLNFEVSGVIKNLYVSVGDRVSQGDLLAELDDTDLQLALRAAKNNLDKANTAYEEVLTSADYNLKTEMLNFQTTVDKLNTPFDSYTYQQNIASAKLALERKQQELLDTQLSNSVTEEAARLNLTRKVMEYEEAKVALAEAENDTAAAFDDFTYQNSIRSAQVTHDRRLKALEDAKAEWLQAKQDNADALSSFDETVREAAEEIIAGYQATVDAMQENYDDALDALNIAKENLLRAQNSHASDEATRIANAISSAQKTVETAGHAVFDAQTAVNNAKSDAQKKVASAQQAIVDAETTLQSAYDSLDRAYESYLADLAGTRNTYESQQLKIENMTQSTSSIQNALYAIEEAKTNLEAAENNLNKIKIYAPIDGEVLSLTKKVGEIVTESTSTPGFIMGTNASSSNLITIRDTSQIYLTARIAEGDIVGVQVGQKIKVAVDALGEENLYATVYSVSSIPNVDTSGIITYEVVGVLDSLHEDIRDNMSVFLTFIKREINNVLLIPNKSVFIEDGQQYVYVQHDDESLEKRAVICGFSNGMQTEVQEGLSVGETVVVGKVNL